jgi:hypothetical protein
MAEPKSINESCLNYQFEATNVNRIVQDVLQKILLKDADDEPLRKTILGQFHNGLAAKGRVFAIEDTNRRLEVINEMTDHALAETETQIMIGNFERILASIQLRNRQGSSVLPQTVVDWLEMLKMLLTVKWPHNPSTYVEQIRREFKQRFFQTVAEIFAYRYQFLQERTALFMPLMERLFDFDRGADFEGFLNPSIRPFITNIRKQMQPS